MEKRWAIIEQGDETLVNKLAKELCIGKQLANLLVQRGINTFEEAKAFFRPELSLLHDPFLMKDMDKAVQRISSAIKNSGENTCLRRL